MRGALDGGQPAHSGVVDLLKIFVTVAACGVTIVVKYRYLFLSHGVDDE